MDQAQRETFRQRLVEQRDRLLEDIARGDDARVEIIRRPGDSSDLPTHPADHDAEGLDEHLTVDRTLRDELQEVNEALDRIHNGDYGKCQRCGNEIAAERLEAIPFTSYCIQCEREEEAERAAEAAG